MDGQVLVASPLYLFSPSDPAVQNSRSTKSNFGFDTRRGHKKLPTMTSFLCGMDGGCVMLPRIKSLISVIN